MKSGGLTAAGPRPGPGAPARPSGPAPRPAGACCANRPAVNPTTPSTIVNTSFIRCCIDPSPPSLKLAALELRLAAFRHHRQKALIGLATNDPRMRLPRSARLQPRELLIPPVVHRMILQLHIDVRLARRVRPVRD